MNTKELSTIEKLDKVLIFFNSSTFLSGNLGFTVSWVKLNEQLFKENISEISKADCTLIINQLLKEKYIEQQQSQYVITMEGKLFIESGGYVSRNLDKVKFETYQIAQTELQNKIYNATVVLAIGTVGLLVWEILIYILECPCH